MSVPVRSFREVLLQEAWDRLVDADRRVGRTASVRGMWPRPAVEKHGGATKCVSAFSFLMTDHEIRNEIGGRGCS